MDNIKSFELDHDAMTPGFYCLGEANGVYTYDMRFKYPNKGDYISYSALHSIEHLFAVVIRNSEIKDKVVYFGPMGCRTGFYLLLAGDYESKDIIPLMVEMWEFIRDFSGEVPGACARDCGNYLDMNLPMANWLAKRYLDEVLYGIREERLVYPE